MKIPALSLIFSPRSLPAAPPRSPQEYAQRRTSLASQLPDGVFIVRGASVAGAGLPVVLSVERHAVPEWVSGAGRRTRAAEEWQRQAWTLFVQTKDPGAGSLVRTPDGPDSASRPPA